MAVFLFAGKLQSGKKYFVLLLMKSKRGGAERCDRKSNQLELQLNICVTGRQYMPEKEK